LDQAFAKSNGHEVPYIKGMEIRQSVLGTLSDGWLSMAIRMRT